MGTSKKDKLLTQLVEATLHEAVPSIWKRFWSWLYKLCVDEKDMKLRMGPLLYLFMLNIVILLITLGWVIVSKLITNIKVETNLLLGFLGTLTTFSINLISIYKHKKLTVENQPVILPTQTTSTPIDLSSIPVIGQFLSPKTSTTDQQTGKTVSTPTPSTPTLGKDIKPNSKISSGDNS